MVYTKDQLSKFNNTELKKIALGLGIDRWNDKPPSKWIKKDMIEAILDKNGGKTPPKQQKVKTPPKQRKVKTPPKQRKVKTPPKQQKVKTPPPKQDTEKIEKIEKIDWNFKELMDINLDLKPIGAGSPPHSSKDDDVITPEMLLKMLKEDWFAKSIVGTLLQLYTKKEKKYKALVVKLTKLIAEDIKERDQLKGAADQREIEKMFPMIIVNQVLMVKVRELELEAKTKKNQFLTQPIDVLVNLIRLNMTDAITNTDNGINSISGDSRAYIRNNLTKQLYILSKGWRPYMDSFLNMVFTGPAGVGKTKLATAVGYVYAKSGILLKGNVIVTSPKDLVGEYVGQTAGKAAGVLMKGLENIIFIDEAYQIMPCVDGAIEKGTTSFGPEAITEIVNFLDKYIGLSIMIVAGYQKEIDGCFIAANEGLPRRFPIRWPLPPYSNTDLLNIFLNEAVRRLGKNIFTKEISLYIYTLIVKLSKADDKIFVNQAGDMMNLVSIFLNVYYGSYKVRWGKFDQDLIITNSAFNQYLRNKGYRMTIN